MIRNIATFTIPQSSGAEIFKWPFRPKATVPRWPKESGASWKFSLARSTASGWRSWDKIRQQLFASKMNPEERRHLLHELASREAFRTHVLQKLNVEEMGLEKNHDGQGLSGGSGTGRSGTA